MCGSGWRPATPTCVAASTGSRLQVQEALKRAPHDGQIFVFRGRRGDLVKVLWHDGQGYCLFSKRLDRGRFLWPSVADGAVTITPAQLGYLSGRHRLARAAEDLASAGGGMSGKLL